jgi:hypothetical protein
MTRRVAAEFLVLLALCGAGTWFLGWWAVPTVAAGWAWLRPGARAWVAGAAAAAAWSLLLAELAIEGPLGAVAVRVGGIFSLPGGVMLLLSPLYAFGLAWSAARLVRPYPATGMANITTPPPGSRSENSSMP